MGEDKGRYLIKHSSGASIAMGEIGMDEAIATAINKGIKDPGLQLIKITDQGGCVVDWKPEGINGAREVYSKMMSAISC